MLCMMYKYPEDYLICSKGLFIQKEISYYALYIFNEHKCKLNYPVKCLNNKKYDIPNFQSLLTICFDPFHRFTKEPHSNSYC